MKKTFKRRLLSGVLAATVAAALMPSAALSAAEADGTPYADGAYDVSVPHVIINQVYGAGDDGTASHSFIELYNQCGAAVDITGWQLQYRSSESGGQTEWSELTLEGSIPAGGFYLVRCAAVTDNDKPDYNVPEGDAEWDIMLHNKGVSVALFSEDTELDQSFSGVVTDKNRPKGYVDLIAARGNDGEEEQTPYVYEGAYSDIQSKKKAIRRKDFADTDNNADDAEVMEYEGEIDLAKAPHNSQYTAGGDEDDEPAPEPIIRENGFEQNAALAVDRLNSIQIGEANKDGAVAEIVAYNSDREEAYVVNGQDGLLYCFDVTENGLVKTGSKDMRGLIEGFEYGDMTSVAVDTAGDRIAVALQANGYADTGRIAVLDYDFNLINAYEVGVQPDMTVFTGDGGLILSADEGEPREGYDGGAQDPAGSVSIIDTETGEVTVAGFEAFSSEELIKQGVIIGKVDGKLNDAALDLEPEYIAVSEDGGKAYVSLQEANAVAVVDLENKEIAAVKSLGFKDLSLEENAADLIEDGDYEAKTYPNAAGVYMPDALSLFEADGAVYLVTANEGDSREWGDYSNEKKQNLTASDGSVAEDVRVLDKELTVVPDGEKEYLFGGRSFSIYNADTMEQVYDSGNDFEAKTYDYLPDYFNCSNDDLEIDSRSAKKGPEAESVTVGEINGRTYAFIGLERIGGVMIYDVTVPAAPEYVNYVNSRDFSTELGGDNSPEGLAFLTLDGKPMLLAACEGSGTVAAYSLTAAEGSGTGGENGSGTDNGGNDTGAGGGGESGGNGTGAETDGGGAVEENEAPEIGRLGDERNPAAALAALAASAAALFGALLLRRKSSII